MSNFKTRMGVFLRNMKRKKMSDKLNVLRAGVLGANDGIVSIAGLVVGVASATHSEGGVLLSGIAATVAGAFSMAGGEFASVSTQKDTEIAAVEKQKKLLEESFDCEVVAVAKSFHELGMDYTTAYDAAKKAMKENPLEVSVHSKYSLEADNFTNPWQAAAASFIAFSIGAALPLLVMLFMPQHIMVGGTFAVVTVALAITGGASAYLGDANITKAIIRNVAVGLITMTATYLIGHFLNVQV
jgi:VIT1/CCC1 family predicted Fe2+/Mn2+ transporter